MSDCKHCGNPVEKRVDPSGQRNDAWAEMEAWGDDRDFQCGLSASGEHGPVTSVTQKVGEWSFEVRADGKDLYFYAAHESETPPAAVMGEPSCESMEWATRLTVEEGWA